MIVHSGCVGQTPETEQCIPTSMAVDDTMTKTTCCNKNRCNNGIDNAGNILEVYPASYKRWQCFTVIHDQRIVEKK